jgi:hypothetical protein
MHFSLAQKTDWEYLKNNIPKKESQKDGEISIGSKLVTYLLRHVLSGEWNYTAVPFILWKTVQSGGEVRIKFQRKTESTTGSGWWYKVVQIWPERFVCKQITVCPGHIWTTLYIRLYNEQVFEN